MHTKERENSWYRRYQETGDAVQSRSCVADPVASLRGQHAGLPERADTAVKHGGTSAACLVNGQNALAPHRTRRQPFGKVNLTWQCHKIPDSKRVLRGGPSRRFHVVFGSRRSMLTALVAVFSNDIFWWTGGMLRHMETLQPV